MVFVSRQDDPFLFIIHHASTHHGCQDLADDKFHIAHEQPVVFGAWSVGHHVSRRIDLWEDFLQRLLSIIIALDHHVASR